MKRLDFIKTIGLSSVCNNGFMRDWTELTLPVIRIRMSGVLIRDLINIVWVMHHSTDLLESRYVMGGGPVWSSVGKYLLWSDIPNDRQMRWLQDDGHVSQIRKPAGNSNGNTFDHYGRQISCEHGNQRVVRYELNSSVTILTDDFAGKKYNAPNDVVVHPDGSMVYRSRLWKLMNYEGRKLIRGAFNHSEGIRISDRS